MQQQGNPREQSLRRNLLAPFAAFAWGTGAQHLDPDLIAMHASGELPADQGLAAAAHLAVCDDGRCRALLREEAAALEAMRRAMFEVAPESSSRSDRQPRTFECPDSLWELFEGMASELGCPVDELINDAMQVHMHSRGYSLRQAEPADAGRPGAPPAPQWPPQPLHRIAPPPPPAPQAGGVRPPSPPRATPMPTGAYGTLPPLPGQEPRLAPPPPPPPRQGGYVTPPPPHHPQGAVVTPPSPHQQGGYGAQPPQRHGGYGPPQQPQPSFGGPPQQQFSTLPLQHPAPQGPPPAAPHGGMPPLVVIHAAGRTLIDKDRFIIGRGKQSSDLAIKDPNISRQHATVEFVGGRFYIVDMGSTNGILSEGERIARKQIQEGDRFIIGDHEIIFSYRT